MSAEEAAAPAPAKRRWRLTPIVLIVLVNLIGAGAYVAHSARQSRLRANTRACFANQKSYAGAVEMFSLDKNVKLDGQAFNADFVAALIDGGYLRAAPYDPGGGGTGSWKHYVLDPKAPSGIRCLVHGAVPAFGDKNPPPAPEPVFPAPAVKTPARGLVITLKTWDGKPETRHLKRADELHEAARAFNEP